MRWRALQEGHQRCVRCETRSAEGRQIAEFVRTRDGGTFAGENGEREPPRRVSGQSEGQEGVRAPELAPGFTNGWRTRRCSLRFTSQADERHVRQRAAPPPGDDDATRGVFASGGHALHGDAEASGLVDEVVGDARTGERDHALGEEAEQLVVPPEGSGPAVGVPVGLADDLVDAVPLGPTGCYLLGTGAAAVDEDDVGVLGFQLVELADDLAGVGGFLATRDGDERSLREVGRVLAVLFRALEVTRLDHRRRELAGLRDVRSSPWPPDLAGLDAVGLGGRVAQSFEGVSTGGEIPGPVGGEFELAGADLGAVLFALHFTDAWDELVGGAVEPLGLGVEGVDEAPQEARPLVGELRTVGRCLGEQVECLEDGGGGLRLAPHGPVVELVRSGGGAEECCLFADHGGEGFVLRFVLCVLVHDHLLVVVNCGGSHRSLLSLSSSEGMVEFGKSVATLVAPHFFGHLVEIPGGPLGGKCEYVAVTREGMAVAAELAALQVGEFVEVELLALDFFPQPSPVFLDDLAARSILADAEGVSHFVMRSILTSKPPPNWGAT